MGNDHVIALQTRELGSEHGPMAKSMLIINIHDHYHHCCHYCCQVSDKSSLSVDLCHSCLTRYPCAPKRRLNLHTIGSGLLAPMTRSMSLTIVVRTALRPVFLLSITANAPTLSLTKTWVVWLKVILLAMHLWKWHAKSRDPASAPVGWKVASNHHHLERKTSARC